MPSKTKPGSAIETIKFKGGDIKFEVRPTFALQQDIEKSCQIGIINMAARVASMNLSLTEIAIITATAALHSKESVKNAENEAAFREIVFQAGWQHFLPPVRELLMAFMTAGGTEKNEEPETEDDLEPVK